jgi:hypothetical protein
MYVLHPGWTLLILAIAVLIIGLVVYSRGPDPHRAERYIGQLAESICADSPELEICGCYGSR